jgi:hypothetical protein
MDLHQIQFTYQQEEDRILCRTSFHGPEGLQEIRAWLTRRMVRELWQNLCKSLEKQVALEKPQVAHASAEIVGMAHESSVAEGRAQGKFDTPYQSIARSHPLGTLPLLVNGLKISVQAGRPLRINFLLVQGKGFEFALTPPMLHGFCSILLEAVRRSGWNLELAMPGQSVQSPPAMFN